MGTRLAVRDLMRLTGKRLDLWASSDSAESPHTDVEVLHFRDCEFNDAPSVKDASFALTFSRLHTLSLLDGHLSAVFPSWATWLTPTVLPLLQHLSVLLDQCYHAPDDDPAGLTFSLERLGPQLESLTFAAEEEHDIVPWDAFTSLKRLSIYPSFLDPLDVLASPSS